MYNLNVDTTKLNESGHDIIILANELNEEIEALFTRITNINKRTFEWVGASADEFVRIANIEKIEYIKLVNTLKKYGKILIELSNKYDSVVK